ncbi:hypothetical protein TKK_0009714 [Trichogramma kaykai]
MISLSTFRLNFILVLLSISHVRAFGKRSTEGVGFAWDVTPADRQDYHPGNQLGWSTLRLDDSPFDVRSVSGVGKRLSSKLSDATSGQQKRLRRQVEEQDIVDIKPENKSSREARMMPLSSSSSAAVDSWSKSLVSPPAAYRHRYDQYDPIYDDDVDNSEAANLPPLIRAHYAPKTDFVTSGRGRSLNPHLDGRYPEARESRDLPVSRTYEDYDVPVFRNIVREHDFDVQLPKNYYPSRHRSQRDFYHRGAASSIPYNNRYRDEDEDYETYGRYRPMPKPKRIIYYATLPEIVRKPVDLRNYQRPYEAVVVSASPQLRPEAQIEPERNRVAPNTVAVVPAEPSRRPLRYSYDNNYDNYVKRSSYYDRRRPPYAAGGEDRLDRMRASFNDRIRSDDRRYESLARSVNDRKTPWPIQIGAEVNVKENERIPGRKFFGQIDNYGRYDDSRYKKIIDNEDRKEVFNDERKNNERINNTNSNSYNNNDSK